MKIPRFFRFEMCGISFQWLQHNLWFFYFIFLNINLIFLFYFVDGRDFEIKLFLCTTLFGGWKRVCSLLMTIFWFEHFSFFLNECSCSCNKISYERLAESLFKLILLGYPCEEPSIYNLIDGQPQKIPQ